MAEPKTMTEKESLELISTMIQRARNSFNENGRGAILWGAVVGLCGFLSFIDDYFTLNFFIDPWILCLLALIPHAIITYQENKQNKVRSHSDRAIDAVWMVYGLSVFALVAYFNIVGAQSDRIMHELGYEVFRKKVGTDAYEPLHFFPLSAISLLIMLFGMPTLITGITRNFKPMIVGGIICYLFFIVSLFTKTPVDNLLAGIAGIVSWLIPGLILRTQYRKYRNGHV